MKKTRGKNKRRETGKLSHRVGLEEKITLSAVCLRSKYTCFPGDQNCTGGGF